MKSSPKKIKRYSISLALIVKNEERCLERCLKSFDGLVDEIVVCDTGSTDRTVEIAEACGAKVVHFAWIDDFAAARNFVLEQTSGDWRLSVDADEWLADGADVLAELRNTRPNFSGRIEQVSISTKGDVSSVWVGRLTPRGVGFTGSIHEQVERAVPEQLVGIAVHHDGYALNPDDMAAKHERYAAMLHGALASEVDPSMQRYYRFQLAKESFALRQYQQSLDFAQSAWGPDFAELPWVSDLLEVWFASAAEVDWQRVLLVIDELGEYFATTARFWFFAARSLMRIAEERPEIAGTVLPMAFQFLQTAMNVPEGKLTDGGRGYGTYRSAELMAALLRVSNQVEDAERFDAIAARMRAQDLKAFLPQ